MNQIIIKTNIEYTKKGAQQRRRLYNTQVQTKSQNDPHIIRS
jgi:hypothetical protein